MMSFHAKFFKEIAESALNSFLGTLSQRLKNKMANNNLKIKVITVFASVPKSHTQCKKM
jgi:hypothetical protein